MIIPCIDLQGGKAVQLVRGRRLKLSVDDVLGLLERFREYPIMHVIDLDAALRKGSNAQWIKALCERANMKVRVGGGIRTIARADKILSVGRGKSNYRQRRISRTGKVRRASSKSSLRKSVKAESDRRARYLWRPHRRARLARKIETPASGRDSAARAILLGISLDVRR